MPRGFIEAPSNALPVRVRLTRSQSNPMTAQAITARPALSLALTVALSLLVVWLGLGIAYFSVYPAGFFIATISFVLYALARLLGARLGGRRARLVQTPASPPPRGVIA